MSDEKKNLFDKIKEINAAEREAEAERERIEAEERAAREKEAREAYQERLRRERIELMKAKQSGGDEEEEEAPKEKEPERKLTFKEKIVNFVYFYKWHVIVTAGVMALVSFLIYDYVTTPKGDSSMMFTIYDCKIENYAGEVEELFNSYTPDVNGDGTNYFEIVWMGIPFELDGINYEQAQSGSVQMMARFDSPESMLIIADSQVAENYGLEGSLVDLREKYPQYENIDACGFYLKGTNFCKLVGMDDDEIPDDAFIGLRKVKKGQHYTAEMEENYKVSEEILDKLIKDCMGEE